MKISLRSIASSAAGALCMPSFSSRLRPAMAAMAFIVGSLFGQSAEAGAIIVGKSGTAGGCTVPTIQAAINRARGFGGYNLILVTDDVPDGVWHENLALEELVEDNQLSLEIVGGFNNCADLEATGFGKASIYGGDADHPVLRIRRNSPSMDVKLRNLWMEGGSRENYSTSGSGILFEGKGRVELTDVTVVRNHVGGIEFIGRAGEAQLHILGGVDVSTHPFYGIAVDGTAVLIMRGDRNTVRENGWSGISIFSPALADISGTGAVLSGNGDQGLYIGSNASNSGRTTRVYSTDPTNPLSIEGNRGGAIGMFVDGSAYRLCTKNVVISGNVSAEDSAIHVKGSQARLEMNGDCEFPPEADIVCVGCRKIENNSAATGKPLIAAVDGATISIDRMRISDNSASSILSTNLGTVTSGSSITLTNSIVHSNNLQSNLFESLNGGIVDIWDSTIAQNGGGFPLSLVGINPGLLQVSNSIIDQPQALLWLEGDPSTVRLNRVMVSNRTGAQEGDELLLDAPAYMPGSLRLTPNSPGVDYGSPGGGVDFDGHPRDVDTTGVDNVHGPRDLGAYESQAAMIDTLFTNGFDGGAG